MVLEENLEKLEDIRKELLDRAIELRNKLNDQNELSRKKIKSLNLNEIVTNEKEILAESLDEVDLTQMEEMTRTVTGINYRNVNKKWLGDNIWQYKATVELKELQFKLEVTIDQQKEDDHEVVDINCHFTRTGVDYVLELSPWVLDITREKNLSLLMSVFSDYNLQCNVRKKILNKLKTKKIVTVENCQNEGGGIITSVHSPELTAKPYVKYLWRIKLTPKTLTIDHIFTIEDIDDGFLKANRQLIKSFCKKSLKKEKLEELWNNLCIAIDEYKA